MSAEKVTGLEGHPERQKLPEFAPLREYIKSLIVEVVIYDENDNEIRKETMDYGNPADRIWLGKISVWAWNNGFVVETSKKE